MLAEGQPAPRCLRELVAVVRAGAAAVKRGLVGDGLDGVEGVEGEAQLLAWPRPVHVEKPEAEAVLEEARWR